MVARRVLLKDDEAAVRTAERQRISRELHDSTSQLLVALQLQLGKLSRSSDPETEAVVKAMAQTIRDIHDSVNQLGLPQGGYDPLAEDARLEVAKLFYSLGTGPFVETV